MSTEHLYWGGSTLEGPIRPLEARTFKDVVRRYIDVAVPLPYTRADFLAMPKTGRDAAKAGPYLIACSFLPGTTRRKDEFKDRLVLLFFDIDSGAEAAHLCESPEVIADALYPYNFFAYHTANSTPAAPRLRIGIDLQPCDPERRFRLLAFFANRLSLSPKFLGSAESVVTTQPMFRPNTFVNEEDSPVLASRTNGKPFNADDLPPESKPDQARTYAPEMSFDDTMGLAYLPLAGITVADIREPLFRIDSDCPYHQWTAVAAALRHQFRGEAEAREAFSLWEEWCATGTKYREGEPWRKWKSFHADATGRAPVTLKSLFKYAADEGWENTRISAKVKVSVAAWIASVNDADILMAEGPARIAAIPFQNQLMEESLVNILRSRIRAISQQNIDKATIVKAIRKERKVVHKEEAGDTLEPWLRPIKFIAPSNTFRNALNGVEYAPAAFDNAFSRYLMGKDDGDGQAALGKPVLNPVQHALNVRMIEQVDGVTYDPRFGGDETIFEFEGRTYLNEYRKNTVPAENAANSGKAMRLIRRLLAELVANAEYENVILDYMAYIVQFPGKKIRWFIILQSIQGAGKGTLWEILGAAIGEVNMGIVSPGAMASDFNSWRCGYQVVNFDELKSPGHNRYDIYNKVKDAVTNDRISLNQKFKDPKVAINITNYVATTNFQDCIPLEEGDRRCFVVFSPIQHPAQVARLLSTDLFPKLRRLIDNHKGAIRHALMNHEIRESFNPNGHAPETEFRNSMIEGSKNQLQVAIEKLIHDGEHPEIGRDIIDLNVLDSVVWFDRKFSAPPSTYLRNMGYFPVNGTGLWTHAHHYRPDMGKPSEIIRLRREVGDIEV